MVLLSDIIIIACLTVCDFFKMKNEIIELTKKFITIESISDKPNELIKILDVALSNLQEFTIEKFDSNGIQSALIDNTEKRPDKLKIILNGHLDVIPGKEYQYLPKIVSDKLYGVGSMDMKANAACLIYIFKELGKKLNYPIALQLVTDEEIGGINGTKFQLDKGVRTDFVISAEPTNFDIVYKSKGVLQLRISAIGKTSHSAYPWRGQNAVWKMNDFLNKIKKMYPIPVKEKWVTTVNLSTIKTSNNTFNKIPDDCIIELDIRYISDDSKTILKNIKKILPKDFKLVVIENESAIFNDIENIYIKKLSTIAGGILKNKIVLRGSQGTSDVVHYFNKSCPGIEFGPIGGDIGGDKEWVSISGLDKFTNIIREFLLEIDNP